MSEADEDRSPCNKDITSDAMVCATCPLIKGRLHSVLEDEQRSSVSVERERHTQNNDMILTSLHFQMINNEITNEPREDASGRPSLQISLKLKAHSTRKNNG